MSEIFNRGAAYGYGTDHGDDWRESGLCRQYDAELWYPLGGDSGHRRSGDNLVQEQAAKAICGRCPVELACRAEALRMGDEWGIWGGLNEAERRKIRKPDREKFSTYCTRCTEPFKRTEDRPHAKVCLACADADAVKHRKRRPQGVTV